MSDSKDAYPEFIQRMKLLSGSNKLTVDNCKELLTWLKTQPESELSALIYGTLITKVFLKKDRELEGQILNFDRSLNFNKSFGKYFEFKK